MNKRELEGNQRRHSNQQKLPSLSEKKAMNQIEKKLAKRVESKNAQGMGKGIPRNFMRFLI